MDMDIGIVIGTDMDMGRCMKMKSMGIDMGIDIDVGMDVDMDTDRWSLVPGPGPWSLVIGTWSLVLVLVSGPWSWFLVPGPGP